MLRSLTKSHRLYTNASSYPFLSSRTLFTEYALGIDKFKAFSAKKLSHKNLFVKRFKQAFDAKNLLAKDLSDMLLYTHDDEELDLLLKGFEQYIPLKHASAHVQAYNFGAPLMRLLYIMNKTDLALDLLLNDNAKFLLTSTACTITATQLYNEGRFNDILKLSDHVLEKKFYTLDNKPTLILSDDLMILTFASLLKLGNDEALNKLKFYYYDLRPRIRSFPLSVIVYSVLLALKHNDVNFAIDAIKVLKNSKNPVAINLRLLILARTNLSDAVDLLDRCRNFKPMIEHKTQILYRSTLEELRQFVVESNNREMLNTVDVIISDLERADIVKPKNLEERYFAPIDLLTVTKIQLANLERSLNKEKLENNSNFKYMFYDKMKLDSFESQKSDQNRTDQPRYRQSSQPTKKNFEK